MSCRATAICTAQRSWESLNGPRGGLLTDFVVGAERRAIVRAYFSADGRVDYLLYHVGGTAANNEGFIAAASKVSASFRFAVGASGPYKQSATIALGPSFDGE